MQYQSVSIQNCSKQHTVVAQICEAEIKKYFTLLIQTYDLMEQVLKQGFLQSFCTILKTQGQ